MAPRGFALPDQGGEVDFDFALLIWLLGIEAWLDAAEATQDAAEARGQPTLPAGSPRSRGRRCRR